MAQDGWPEALMRWLKEVSITYHMMELVLPDDVVLDHSAASLDAFGDVLPDVDEVPDFDAAATAYVGQTLLVLAGGHWAWDDAPDSDTFGQPLACPSEELGLVPVAPAELVDSGRAAMVGTYAEWERRVREHTAAHPGWRPAKVLTPFLDAPEPTFDEDRLSTWLAEREQRFPQWVASYGAGGTWDFSPASLDGLAVALFRATPTPERFADLDRAGFVQGATWYLGETLRRTGSGEWIAPHDEEYFRVRQHPGDAPFECPAPEVALRVAVRAGNPVLLRDRFGSWMAPVAAKDRPEPEYRWDGTAWRTPLDAWVGSVAARIDALAVAAPHITLDYSAESLRMLESFCRAVMSRPVGDLVEGIAAYVGEALLRVAGGHWILNDTPSSVSFGRPLVEGANLASPVDLVLLACQWSGPGALTLAYQAAQRFARQQRAVNPAWRAVKAPTPGLDPAPAPTPVESWCAARQDGFPAWADRYGTGRNWDFSRASLSDLAGVVLSVLPTADGFNDPQHAEFVDGAAWYYGEVLRRGKPSEWYHHADLDPDGRFHRGLTVSTLERDRAFPIGVFVVQDLRMMVERSSGTGLPSAGASPVHDFDYWVTAAFRQRTEEALRRRNRATSRRRRPNDHAARWSATQAHRFVEWRKRWGATLGRDFSPESLHALELVIRQVAPTPEDLLEKPENAEFLDVAAWYYGETLRRSTDLVWTYCRDEDPDCYLHRDGGRGGEIFPVWELADTFKHYEIGSLRRRYDRRLD